MADGSKRVVLAALGGNLAVAAAKFAAAWLSGSSAMLTEAVHSLVDTGDQVLLLIGQARGERAADASHPLGYGMETYFWSFIVALMVFILGGAVSINTGVEHLLHPHPITAPWVNLGVLAVAAVLEGGSLLVGLREYRRIVRGRPVGVWAFIRASKDPGVFSVILEDSAAELGIALAAAGVVGSSFLGLAWADGAASLAIGALLVGVALVLANETRSLIAGEAVAAPVLERVKAALGRETRIAEVIDIATLQLGPRAILVAITARFAAPMEAAAIETTIAEVTAALRDADPRIAHVYLRPPPDLA
jgi:cation diffusion facilitator family transporter